MIALSRFFSRLDVSSDLRAFGLLACSAKDDALCTHDFVGI